MLVIGRLDVLTLFNPVKKLFQTPKYASQRNQRDFLVFLSYCRYVGKYCIYIYILTCAYSFSVSSCPETTSPSAPQVHLEAIDDVDTSRVSRTQAAATNDVPAAALSGSAVAPVASSARVNRTARKSISSHRATPKMRPPYSGGASAEGDRRPDVDSPTSPRPGDISNAQPIAENGVLQNSVTAAVGQVSGVARTSPLQPQSAMDGSDVPNGEGSADDHDTSEIDENYRDRRTAKADDVAATSLEESDSTRERRTGNENHRCLPTNTEHFSESAVLARKRRFRKGCDERAAMLVRKRVVFKHANWQKCARTPLMQRLAESATQKYKLSGKTKQTRQSRLIVRMPQVQSNGRKGRARVRSSSTTASASVAKASAATEMVSTSPWQSMLYNSTKDTRPTKPIPPPAGLVARKAPEEDLRGSSTSSDDDDELDLDCSADKLHDDSPDSALIAGTESDEYVTDQSDSQQSLPVLSEDASDGSDSGGSGSDGSCSSCGRHHSPPLKRTRLFKPIVTATRLKNTARKSIRTTPVVASDSSDSSLSPLPLRRRRAATVLSSPAADRTSEDQRSDADPPLPAQQTYSSTIVVSHSVSVPSNTNPSTAAAVVLPRKQTSRKSIRTRTASPALTSQQSPPP